MILKCLQLLCTYISMRIFPFFHNLVPLFSEIVIFMINCSYNFNPCGVFEKMTSFSPILNQNLEQGKLMAAVNSRKKGPKTMNSNVRNR